MLKGLILVSALFFSGLASAEYAVYENVELYGLARDNGFVADYKGRASAMVCNINGTDKFLSVRSGPGTEYKIKRKLERLAIIVLDLGQRQGRWIKVKTAYRTHDTDGFQLDYTKPLPVKGWVHDGYLCAYGS